MYTTKYFSSKKGEKAWIFLHFIEVYGGIYYLVQYFEGSWKKIEGYIFLESSGVVFLEEETIISYRW